VGDAKRRAKEIATLKGRIDAWRVSLSAAEHVIAKTAERLDERLVRGRHFTEGCYHLAFFMTQYLALQGIRVKPVIGWINDGLWDGATSHAWIEFDGKITDASLTLTTHPETAPTGALIIQGFVVRSGQASYTYFQNDDPNAGRMRKWVASRPEWSEIQTHKEAQHQQMLKIVQDGLITDYLAAAPTGGKYAEIASLIA
jgi:hypothetical protein